MKRDLAEYVEHFRHRVLQDALAEATSAYWLRRAETFAAVGDTQCDEIATACRNHARLLKVCPLITGAEVVTALREAA